jgi:hypothetical protein
LAKVRENRVTRTNNVPGERKTESILFFASLIDLLYELIAFLQLHIVNKLTNLLLIGFLADE